MKALITQNICLNKETHIRNFLFTGTPEERNNDEVTRMLMSVGTHPEPIGTGRDIAIIGFRKAVPPLHVRSVAICGEKDPYIKGAAVANENTTICMIPNADHGLIFDRPRIRKALEKAIAILIPK